MGNRAVITFSKDLDVSESPDCGIYLHWNGGRDSVEAFAEYCRLRGFRTGSYGLARMTQVIANFFGGGLSIGIGPCCELDCDNGDNGVYVLGDNWEIVGRRFGPDKEPRYQSLNELLHTIDDNQPVPDRLGGFLDGKPTATKDLKVGDSVWVHKREGQPPRACKVCGLGATGAIVNGTNVSGLPFVDLYGTEGDYSSNINNYLRDPEYRLVCPVVWDPA